jgi:hypothetical protein
VNKSQRPTDSLVQIDVSLERSGLRTCLPVTGRMADRAKYARLDDEFRIAPELSDAISDAPSVTALKLSPWGRDAESRPIRDRYRPNTR